MRWRDSSSAGYRVGNCDLTIVAQRPRLAAHVPAMREKVAELLGIEVGQVSVKATTTDHLGFVGRAEGIAAMAVACSSRERVLADLPIPVGAWSVRQRRNGCIWRDADSPVRM